MNLLADENVDRQIVERLRQDGHCVVYVAEIAPSVSDDLVLEQANQDGAILITADKDFGELVYRQGRIHAGVLLLRLAGLSPMVKADVASAVLRDRGPEIQDAFAVVSPRNIRIRRRL
jgi:predicted nuclease of predicted toxin-antitoxin system